MPQEIPVDLNQPAAHPACSDSSNYEGEEVETIESSASLTEKEKWIVNAKWWDQWKAYTNFGITPKDQVEKTPVQRPGRIDNSDLLFPDQNQLKPRLIEHKDFVVVSGRTWIKLCELYPDSGPELRCPVIFEGAQKKPRVILYPITLKVHYESKPAFEVCICATASVSDLKRKICEALKLSEESHQLIDYFQFTPKSVMDDQSPSLPDLMSNQDILVQKIPESSVRIPEDADLEGEVDETDDKEGNSSAIIVHMNPETSPNLETTSSVPSVQNKSFFKKKYLPPTIEDSIIKGSSGHPGLVGLGNLGNTCYMNSGLQCMLHSVPFMRSFLGGQFKQDINKTNPLGHKGELAESFANLMGNIWKANVQYVQPRSFKSKIGRFCPVFSGYGQQDSQELLAFLLDGLHEDLNRIRDKPYLQDSSDCDLLQDDELAAKQWANHRSRNDSLVVDHCLGMYRSTLICPQCNHTSRKFDPVMYLSLPLPESRIRCLSIVMVHVDGSQAPTKYSVEVPSVGTVKDLLYAIAKVSAIEVLAPSVTPSVSSSRVASVACSLDALGGSGGGGIAVSDSPPKVALFERPQDILLLARIQQSYNSQGVEAFLDVKTRVSEVVPHEKAYNPEFLVCYRYPCAAAGPGNKELQLVTVHHRRRKPSSQYGTKIFSAPLLLLLPKSQAVVTPEELTVEGGSYNREYLVSNTTEVASNIHQALRPFLTGPLADPSLIQKSKEDLSSSVEVAAGPGPEVMGDLAEECTGDPAVSEQDQEVNTRVSATIPSINMADDGTGDMKDKVGGDMEWEGCSDVTASTNKKISVDESEPRSPKAQEPFDMWNQGGTAERSDICNGATRQHGPQFVVRVSKNERVDTLFFKDTLDEACDTFTFAVDWFDPLSEYPGSYDSSMLENPRSHESQLLAEQASLQGRRPVSLSSCFEAFLQPEQLSEDDSWYCPKCKDHVQADKKLDLWHLPEMLVVHLKRFCFTRTHREKLNTQVDFPLEGLDLSRFLMRPQGVPPIYDCYAVSNHFGGMGGGHYTAFCKMPQKDQWYCFDDSHVSPVESSEIQTSAAYVLFYRRRHEVSLDPPDLLQQLIEARMLQESDAVTVGGKGSYDQHQSDQDLESGWLTSLPPGEPMRASQDNVGDDGNSGDMPSLLADFDDDTLPAPSSPVQQCHKTGTSSIDGFNVSDDDEEMGVIDRDLGGLVGVRLSGNELLRRQGGGLEDDCIRQDEDDEDSMVLNEMDLLPP